MSVDHPKEWITAILQRFDHLLALSVTQSTDLTAQLESYKESLINISQTKCSLVVSGLTCSLKKLSSIRIYGERQEVNLYTSQIIVLNLLEKCISVKESALSEDSMMMKQLLPEICQFLYQSASDRLVLNQLHASASRVLYCISENSFNVVFNRISARLQDLSSHADDSMDLNDLELIKHVHLNIDILIKLLEEFVLKFRNLKKSAQLLLLANFDAALRNWLNTYPVELNQLYKPVRSGSNQPSPAQSIHLGSSALSQGRALVTSQEDVRARRRRLGSAAEKIFNFVEMLTEGSKKKAAQCWPLQTVLLLLCPDIIDEIMRGGPQSRPTKHDFFNNLKRFLSTSIPRQTQENCVESLIRLLKAATCVAPNDAGCGKVPLHQLADTVSLELQTFLFKNGPKHFAKSSDREALIDCFVTNFRLHPDDGALARLCASSSSTINHKMVLVQALCFISTQPCLAWWPRVDALYSYGSDVRTIFKDCAEKLPAQLQTSPRSGQSLREKMERMNVGLKRSQDDSPTIRDLLCVILQLVQGDPQVFLHNLASTPQEIHSSMIELVHYLVALFSVQSTPNLHLSFESLGALLRLHDPRVIPRWNPEAGIATFWEVSSNMVTSVCDKLLTHQMVTSHEVTLHALKWLHQILACRIEYLVQNQDKGSSHRSDGVKRATFKLEMTLLEHLWHPSVEVVMVALSCFRGMFEEAELRWSFDDFGVDRTYVGRHDNYQELATAAILEGDESMHEKVRAVLRRLTKFPSASVEAWEDALAKWEARTHSLSYKQTKDETGALAGAGEGASHTKAHAKRPTPTKEDVAEWTLMTGFLCSLGGVCSKTVDAVSSSLSSLAWDRRTSNSSVCSASTVPCSPTDPLASGRTPNGGKNILSVAHASRFIGHLTNMLANQSTRIADITVAVRDQLATSLHPALYPTLFQQISIVLKTNLFDDSGKINPSLGSDVFICNVIHILHNIFRSCSDQDGEYLGEESIENMVLYLVRYVRHLGTRATAFPLRIAFCLMVTEMMNRRNDFFFLSEIKFRNKLVESIADWLMASSSQNIELNKSLLREMDASAILAMSSLLNGLPLHPDEGDGGDVPQAKSQLFLKYFTLFMRLLSECGDETDDGDVISDDATTRVHVTSLCKNVVVAMSNLLSANIEYGFVHAMGLAYHPDPPTRASFLEVLIEILQQGSSGFDTLGDTVSAERFERLVELVTMMGDNGELPIANALANVVHTSYMDELARVFVTLFDAKHLLYQLLWNMFTKEVEEADSVQTLFRGNSLASKILTFCFKVYGASYLHNLVEPLVAWSLSPEIVDLKFDVDQKRLPQGVDIFQCRANLQRLTERFFTRIMTSTDRFPPQLKSVCHCLYQVVTQRFHESGTGAVASAIFLRFLNPSIATPYECGLCEKQIPPNLARAFKFMCKLMQNIANHVLFTKEEHMKHFNEFVKARFDVCQQFFMQVSTPECTTTDGMVHSLSFMNDANVQALHRLLWNNQEKIGRYLAKSRDAKAAGRRPFDKMVTLLAYLGPPEYTRPVLETRIPGQNMTPCKFEELMAKRKISDSEEYKLVKGLNIFYQFGRSKMGYPVFYYIARRYINTDIREDILMYYILQALKPYSARKFDVIIDLTHVESKNGFRAQYLPKWFVIYTPMIYKNLDKIYIYNPNTWIRGYVCRHQQTFDQIKQPDRVMFISKLSELQEFIEVDHQKVPSATSSLDEDVTVYRNAYRCASHARVDIKLGCRAVQFTTIDKCKLLGHDVTLNDIYYSHEIESIQAPEDCNTFCLKVASSNTVMMFSHPEATRIAQGLRHIRARWELSQPEQDISTHHKIEAKDVPGTLLNMALLNLGCSNPAVRSSAYNLLCALTTTFNLQLDGKLCESEGLCIPANNTLFIASISRTLARNEAHLTLEFLDECITGFPCLSDTLKNLCLVYMEPWLSNLAAFVTSDAIKRNKVKSIIFKLIELTVAEKDFYPSVQIKIWGNLGKMGALIDPILESFIETCSQGGLGSFKAEVMADTSVSLSAHNIKLVSSKLINRLCHVVDKTSLRPTPTLEKHKHWDEIAILARFLLMLSFNNNLDVASHLPYLFHLVTLLLSTGPVALRASIHGLVVNIIHSLLTCNQPEFKGDTRSKLRLALTQLCLPKFYCCFGISSVQSAADTAFKSEPFVPDASSDVVAAQKDVAVCESGCLGNDDVVKLSYLEVVCDALLDVMEACVKDVVDCDWLSEWAELNQKLAFQYNPSIQPRALVTLGCISKKPSMRHIKKILGIMGRSLESQADPLLLESALLALTRLQLVCEASTELKATFFWVGITAMQVSDAALYAAGLALVEQNLLHLHEVDAFASQTFWTVLMKSRSCVERLMQSLEVAVGLSFQSSFHFAFVYHLAKGLRHPDPLVVTLVIRVLEFSLELISHQRPCHKYEINNDSLPYIAALLPFCDEVRRHCSPRKKPSSGTASHNSTTSSKRSNGRRAVASNGPAHPEDFGNCSDAPSSGSLSSRSRHNSTLEADSAVPGLPRPSNPDVRHHPASAAKPGMKMSKRAEGRENGLTPPKIRKVGELAQDSDSSTSSGSHLTSSSVRSSRRKHSLDLSCNALFAEEFLDMKSQALLLTLLATQVQHCPKNSDVQILFEYLAEASVIFPSMFPIVYSLLDRKISSILNRSEDTSLMVHVQTIVHNAAMYNEDELVMRQLTFLQDIGFGGVCRFAVPFAKAASLENASIVVKLIDNLVNHYLGDVPDLTPVPSRQSLNSALSAASADDVPDTSDSELSDIEQDDVMEVASLSSHNVGDDVAVNGRKNNSFRNKGPKLTIKLPK